MNVLEEEREICIMYFPKSQLHHLIRGTKKGKTLCIAVLSVAFALLLYLGTTSTIYATYNFSSQGWIDLNNDPTNSTWEKDIGHNVDMTATFIPNNNPANFWVICNSDGANNNFYGFSGIFDPNSITYDLFTPSGETQIPVTIQATSNPS